MTDTHKFKAHKYFKNYISHQILVSSYSSAVICAVLLDITVTLIVSVPN